MATESHVDHTSEDYPPWGSMPLDVFMLDEWETTSEHHDEQRSHLAREFLALGRLGRQPYAERAAKGDVQPTDTQIATILRPLRAPILRQVAQTLDNAADGTVVWLRMDYEDPQRHKTLCEGLLDLEFGENLYDDPLILSDERFYKFSSWPQLLEIMPDILDGQFMSREREEQDYRGGNYRRKLERAYMQGELEKGAAGDTLSTRQSLCSELFLLVEDAEMYDFDPPRFHAIWPDDCGNIVRQTRMTAQDACLYPPMAQEGMGPEQEVWIEAEVGPEYVGGGKYGPPFHVTGPSNG